MIRLSLVFSKNGIGKKGVFIREACEYDSSAYFYPRICFRETSIVRRPLMIEWSGSACCELGILKPLDDGWRMADDAALMGMMEAGRGDDGATGHAVGEVPG